MSYKIDIYVGSDNGSRKIKRDYLSKITRWADENIRDGYTILRGRGYYGGMGEESVLINVVSPLDIQLRSAVERLKQELNQEAILVVRSQVDLEMI